MFIVTSIFDGVKVYLLFPKEVYIFNLKEGREYKIYSLNGKNIKWYFVQLQLCIADEFQMQNLIERGVFL